jgi:Ca-activated chloride channel family protein
MSETNGIDPGRYEKLCAYVFGELPEKERLDFEIDLARDAELRRERDQLLATATLVKRAIPDEGLPADVRRELLARARRSRFHLLCVRPLAQLAAALLALLGGLWAWRALAGGDAPEPERLARHDEPVSKLHYFATSLDPDPAAVFAELSLEENEGAEAGAAGSDPAAPLQLADLGYGGGGPSVPGLSLQSFETTPPASAPLPTTGAFLVQKSEETFSSESPFDSDAFKEVVGVGGGAGGKIGGRFGGKESLRSAGGNAVPGSGMIPERPSAAARARPVLPAREAAGEAVQLGVPLQEPTRNRAELEQLGYGAVEPALLDALGYSEDEDQVGRAAVELRAELSPADQQERARCEHEVCAQRTDELLGWCRLQPGESPRDMFFRCWGDNPFVLAQDDPLSTFSIDVDPASYTLARGYLMQNQLPPRVAVRTEEFVNYFRADQPAPADGSSFAIALEAAPSPFAGGDPRVELLRITVRAKDLTSFERAPLALTLVIDNSGSMKEGGRLELVKGSVLALLRELNALDSVAVVVFSQEARVLHERVSAANRGELETAVYGIPIEGGTNAEAGLVLGYEVAAVGLTPGSVNRVVFFSDGVANIGELDQKSILDTVRENRSRGIYLNTFGVGLGNHDDHFLEQLADQGDGSCHYLDSLAEAKKLLVEGLVQAFQPVARDVKIQVEFDPAQVESWRQLGYENRALRHEDFRDDAIDAGEVNAGHQVSALYELVRMPHEGGPFATVRLRYKPPYAIDRGLESARAAAEAEAALEIQAVVHGSQVRPSFAAASGGFQRSALVAQFAEVLRDSVHARQDSYAHLLEEARRLERQLGEPEFSEFLGLLERANPLLDARAKQATPALRKLVDELCLLRYEQGQRERKHQEVQPEQHEREQARIQELERAIQGELRKLYAPDSPPQDAQPPHEETGYGDR